MFRDFLNYFNESEEIKNSGNLYNDFILQLGGKRFGNGVFNSFSDENLIEKSGTIREKAVPSDIRLCMSHTTG